MILQHAYNTGFHAGKNDMQFVKFPAFVFFQQFLSDPAGTVKSRILGCIQEIFFQRNILFDKILPPQLSYNKKFYIIIRIVDKLLGSFQYVMVKRACQPFVEEIRYMAFVIFCVSWILLM